MNYELKKVEFFNNIMNFSSKNSTLKNSKRTTMETTEIQNQVKYVTDAEGKPVKVILPVSVYQQWIELPASLEIYQQDDTQKSIRQAQRDLKSGRARAFKVMAAALAWLKR